MIAFIYPGQGSQKRGMGAGLFDDVAVYAGLEREVDAIVGYSMRELCLENSQDLLGKTQYTQPALYVVNALHHFRASQRGERPTHVAGHSLGEYNALMAADVIDFLTGLRLVTKRGELMSRSPPGGGMAAVVGMNAERVAQVLEVGEFRDLQVANFNSSSQIVISGSLAEIQRAAAVFEKAGAQLYVTLAVSAAFHSRHMTQAASDFGEFLRSFTFGVPKIPVIANVTGEPYPSHDITETVRALLSRQISASVLWEQSVNFLLRAGVTQFQELGPGNVLTRLVQQIRKDAAA